MQNRVPDNHLCGGRYIKPCDVLVPHVTTKTGTADRTLMEKSVTNSEHIT
jgi:hypothetical protein